MEQILINSSREEARVAILEDGILKDILVERMCARGLVGNVYYGQVVRVLPGMQSAFLNVGLERTASFTLQKLKGRAPKPERFARSKRFFMRGSA